MIAPTVSSLKFESPPDSICISSDVSIDEDISVLQISVVELATPFLPTDPFTFESNYPTMQVQIDSKMFDDWDQF
eukprot:m.39169 g.39169  ORF g.39169 m.39169 type:complete len:75 (+) comp18107_c0_seq1:473-697(+)